MTKLPSKPISFPEPPSPGGAERDRTDDLLLAKQALSQLSYSPVEGLPGLACRAVAAGQEPAFALSGFGAAASAASQRRLVGQGGFEPPTSRLSSARSNQLSY
jgi:hypothetical protein